MPSTSNADLYGSGVFTTVAIRGGEPWLWEKHWSRLNANAEQIGLDLSGIDHDSTLLAIRETIRSTDLVDGRVRVTIRDERCSEIWPAKGESTTASVSIVAGPRRVVPATFSVGMSPFSVNSRSPLAGVKSCNYLEQIISISEARSRGLHEAVRLTERGHVASASMANIFWLRGSELFTPSLSTGCLAGTTREYILENVDCTEVEAGEAAILEADTIYLSSAGLGVVRPATFMGRSMDWGRSALDDLVLP